MKRKETAFIMGQGLVVGLVLWLVSLPLSGVKEPYEVVKENVTVTGGVPNEIICQVYVPCDSIPYTTLNSSGSHPTNPPDSTLRGVELINYKGSYYYLYTSTNDITVEKQVTGQAGPNATTWVVTNSLGSATTYTYTESLQPVVRFIVWFTNSSIYCIGPAGDYGIKAPVCPG